MNVVKEIQRINAKELATGAYSETGSWHAEYKDSAWIFVGSLPFDLTEGDIVCIFSQYGEVLHVELIRDAKDGKSKGFGFVKYEDQRSTILAVDNLNGATILGRTIRVDHSHTGPKKPKKRGADSEEEEEEEEKMNVAPQAIEVNEGKVDKSAPNPSGIDVDEEDPMAAYFKEKHEKKKSKKDKSEKRHKHKSSRSNGSRRRRSDSRDRDDYRSSRRHKDEHRSRERYGRSRYSSDEEDDQRRHMSSRYDSDGEEDRKRRSRRNSSDVEERHVRRSRYRDDDDDRRRARYSSRERY